MSWDGTMGYCEYRISELISAGEIFSAVIGYDGLVYTIGDEKAYALHVDWENGCEVGKVDEIGAFPSLAKLFFLAPIGEDYLVLGRPAHVKPTAGDAYIVSRDRRRVKQIYIGLGWGRNIFVTEKLNRHFTRGVHLFCCRCAAGLL